jgi:hypothetical protein
MDMFEDCSLREHPNETIRRLKALGVWPEANRLLRKVKQQYRRQAAKSEGAASLTHRLNATKAAWEAVLERWPPPIDAIPLESLAKYLRLANLAENSEEIAKRALTPSAIQRFDQIGDTVNHIEEVIWVYHHLDDEQVDPSTAPSRGAWSMLCHARKDKNRFYEKVYLPLMRDISRRQTAVHRPYKVSDRELASIEDLKKMLRAAVAESQKIV